MTQTKSALLKRKPYGFMQSSFWYLKVRGGLMSWFVVVRSGSWWFNVMVCGGLWWFVVFVVV